MDQKCNLCGTGERHRAQYPDCAPLGCLVQLRMVPNDVLAGGVTGGEKRNRLHHHQVTSVRFLPLVLSITSMVRRLASMWLMGTWMATASSRIASH